MNRPTLRCLVSRPTVRCLTNGPTLRCIVSKLTLYATLNLISYRGGGDHVVAKNWRPMWVANGLGPVHNWLMSVLSLEIAEVDFDAWCCWALPDFPRNSISQACWAFVEWGFFSHFAAITPFFLSHDRKRKLRKAVVTSLKQLDLRRRDYLFIWRGNYAHVRVMLGLSVNLV